MAVFESRFLREFFGKSNPVDKRKENIVTLAFEKDGKTIKCQAICGRGRVGQIVILDRVLYGNLTHNAKYFPLAQYHQPCAFTIIKKVVEKGYDYLVIADADGNRLKTQPDDQAGLYDANEWLAWNAAYEEDQMTRAQDKIRRLKNRLALLQRDSGQDSSLKKTTETDIA
jgi:hypothetical protein